LSFCVLMLRRQPDPSLFPYTTLFRSRRRDLTVNRKLDMILDYLKPSPQEAPDDEGETVTFEPEVDQLPQTPELEKPEEEGAEGRSEEHTSELQSRENLVCRLLLEKKK